jgi:hypothetical protein
MQYFLRSERGCEHKIEREGCQGRKLLENYIKLSGGQTLHCILALKIAGWYTVRISIEN